MKRSATPLPSGSRTKLGELSDAEERDRLLKIVGQVVRPVVVTQPQPTGPRPSPMPPKRSRMPWRIGSRASKRFPRLAAWSPMHAVAQ